MHRESGLQLMLHLGRRVYELGVWGRWTRGCVCLSTGTPWCVCMWTAAAGRCSRAQGRGIFGCFPGWCAGRRHEFVRALCMLAPVVLDCSSHSPSKAPFCLPLCLIKAGERVCCAFLVLLLTPIPLSPARRELQDRNIRGEPF